MKHRTGTLIRRKNRYTVRIVIDGKAVEQALKNGDGTPCQTAKEARKAQAIAVQCFTLANRKQALQAAIRQLAETEAELAALQHPKVKLSLSWGAYLASGERPDSGQGCLANYARHASQFIEWAQTRYGLAQNIVEIPFGEGYTWQCFEVKSLPRFMDSVSSEMLSANRKEG